MVTVIIKNNGENNVIQLTWENLWRELKDIPDAELLVEDDWFKALGKVKNRYVCFVEADCLVNSGYFSSQMGLFEKDPFLRKLAMLCSATAVNNWAVKFYGYELSIGYADGVVPVTQKKSRTIYPVQIGYMPGAIIRVNTLKELLKTFKITNQDDLVGLSTKLSLGFWAGGIGDKEWSFSGNRVHINPNTTYVTTEDYVNDITKVDFDAGKLIELFSREKI